MRLLPALFCLFLICSCSSGKPQFVPPPKPEAPETAKVAEPVVERQPEVAAQKPATKAYADDSFIAILLREGTPMENIIPRSKEQVTVYYQVDHYRFYYFRENRLVAQKDYSFDEIAEMKASERYPDQVLRALGAAQ